MRRHQLLVVFIAAATLVAGLVGCSDDAATAPGIQVLTDSGGDGSAADAGTEDSGPGTPDAGTVKDIKQIGCLDDVECAGYPVELCNAAKCVDGKCQAFPTAEGVGCDDGSECTTGDLCQGGLCSGIQKECNDAKPCTVDSCNPDSGECENTPAPDGQVGTCDDGDACTEGDACTNGVCSGKAVACNDDNPCTDDSCDLANGCLFKNNALPCGDATKCDSGGICSEGKCETDKTSGCDDDNACTTDTCDDKTGLCMYKPGPSGPCNDGDVCTSGEACKEGKCTGGAAKDCPNDANKPCQLNDCNPTSGACELISKDSGKCDDGDACTDGDTCTKGACGGKSKTCDDDNPCTDDSCDSKTGCSSKNNTAPCADNAKCLKGSCADGACKVGSDEGCDDNNPCTSDSCDKSKGCVYTPAKEGASCGDKDACKDASTCKAGKCAVGAKVDCDDLNPCTDDSCDPKVGCGWEANEAACSDGDACTDGDKCSNGKCVAGAKADACDDKNPCTTDTCDKTKGCVHTPHSGKCDDGSVCTTNETCAGGKCAGTQSKCEDGGPCKITNCDPKTGDCSWGGKDGACDDGNFCTSGTVCKAGSCGGGSKKSCDDKSSCTVDKCDGDAGKCVHTPVEGTPKCDDGDKCTAGDTCKVGKCVGSGGPTCDDGNACTVDKCNAETGKCSFGPNKAPCDSGNLCTYGDVCSNGKCKGGANQVCNDGTSCTTDACDAKTGKCTYKAIKDGTACKDGLECTKKETCKAGKCISGDSSTCHLFKDTFECKDKGKGWWLDKPGGKKVLWQVDMTPKVGGEEKSGCNLNFNNGKDYCDKAGNSCQHPTGDATSPLIDGTKLPGPAVLRFRTWYDVDSGGSDRPRVDLISEEGSVLYGFYLSKSPSNMKKWRPINVTVNQVKGKKFRIRFRLQYPNGSGQNNHKGFFIDDLVVGAKASPEICTDKVDNDGNGLIDCFDPACKGKTGCKEICGDGKDNDFDDKVDCADPDCSKSVDCQKPFFSRDFKCGEGGWNVVDMKRNNVTFAIDKTPANPKPVIADCTLNFNNGKNFCGVKDCKSNNSSNANAATATFSKWIDATGYKTLTAVYWSWIDAEPYANNTVYYDRGFMQASVDGFKNCCNATYSCSGKQNQCNSSSTSTWIAPRTANDQKKWRKVTLNLYKFAGKKFQLRYRFNSGDGQKNGTSGWFVDKLRIYGSK